MIQLYIIGETSYSEERIASDIDWVLDTKEAYKEACIQLSKIVIEKERYDKLFKVTIEEIGWSEDYSWVNEKEILNECAKRLK